MQKQFVCIMCPLGCNLSVIKTKNDTQVTGNNCPRGEQYATQELTNPMRTISSLVKYNGGVVPVKTNGLIPKNKIDDCIKEIAKIKLDKKPNYHSVVIKNVCNCGVDIIVCG